MENVTYAKAKIKGSPDYPDIMGEAFFFSNTKGSICFDCSKRTADF